MEEFIRWAQGVLKSEERDTLPSRMDAVTLCSPTMAWYDRRRHGRLADLMGDPAAREVIMAGDARRVEGIEQGVAARHRRAGRRLKVRTYAAIARMRAEMEQAE